MLVILTVLLLTLTASSNGAVISDAMVNDPLVNKFGSLVKSKIAESVGGKFTVAIAPWNTAINGNSAVTDDVLRYHFFKGNDKLGLVAEWSSYMRIAATNGIFYRQTTNNGFFMYLYKRGEFYYVNHGKIVKADVLVEPNQAYQITDQLTTFFSGSTAYTYMKEAAELVKTRELFDGFETAVSSGHFKDTQFTMEKMTDVATFFLPSNAVWDALPTADYTALVKDFASLNYVLNNYYVEKNLIFLRDETIQFDVGFNTNKNRATYTWRENTGRLIINGVEVSVIKPNIIVNNAVIHIVNGSLSLFESVEKRLQTSSKNMVGLLASVKNVSILLANNASVVVPSDAVIAKLMLLPLETRMNYVMMLIIPGLNANSAPGRYTTLNNGSAVYLRVNTLGKYLDYEEPGVPGRRLTVLKIDTGNNLRGGSVFTVTGDITARAPSCAFVVESLDRKQYWDQLTRVGVNLQLGSPYVVLAASDAAISFVLSLNLSVPTSPAPQPIPVPSNITTTAVSSTTPSSAGAAGTPGSSISISPTNLRYLLQRSIFPLNTDFDLTTYKNGQYTVPTVNYAATKERVTMTLSDTAATMALDSTSGVVKRSEPGYRCYGDDKYAGDASRDMIVYPADFLLASNAELRQMDQFCVAPPCAGCSLAVWSGLLAVCVSLATAWGRS